MSGLFEFGNSSATIPLMIRSLGWVAEELSRFFLSVSFGEMKILLYFCGRKSLEKVSRIKENSLEKVLFVEEKSLEKVRNFDLSV